MSGESDVLRCAYHSNQETRLTCGKCGKPICGKCVVITPVGGRCRECAYPKSSRLHHVPWYLYPPAILAALLAGTFGGAMADRIGWFAIFWGPALGAGVGEIVHRVARRRFGITLALIAVASVLVGAATGVVVSSWLTALAGEHSQPFTFGGFRRTVLHNVLDPFLLLYLLLAIPAAFWRTR